MQRRHPSDGHASGEAFRCPKKIADKGAIAFCKEALGFEPTEYQKKFLLETAQFQAQCWSRQSAKNHTALSKVLWYAAEHDGAQNVVVEQTKKTTTNLEGVILSVPAKQEILGYLKLMMQKKCVLFPLPARFSPGT